jgi:hypothetical protein
MREKTTNMHLNPSLHEVPSNLGSVNASRTTQPRRNHNQAFFSKDFPESRISYGTYLSLGSILCSSIRGSKLGLYLMLLDQMPRGPMSNKQTSPSPTHDPSPHTQRNESRASPSAPSPFLGNTFPSNQEDIPVLQNPQGTHSFEPRRYTDAPEYTEGESKVKSDKQQAKPPHLIQDVFDLGLHLVLLL